MSLSLSEQVNQRLLPSLDRDQVRQRVWELERERWGSQRGPYPASLAYNCAMQQRDEDIFCSHPTRARST